MYLHAHKIIQNKQLVVESNLKHCTVYIVQCMENNTDNCHYITIALLCFVMKTVDVVNYIIIKYNCTVMS